MAAYEVVKDPQIVLLKAAEADHVPGPGEGAVLFADADNGGAVTAKLPSGASIAFSPTSVTLTPATGSPSVLGQSYMTDAKLAGAVGDTVETVATIVALEDTAVLDDALTQADVGKVISIEAAGDGADLITTITAVSADGLTVTVADAAVDGATDAVTFVGTPDETALAAGDTAATATGTLLIPPGKYLVGDDLTLAAGTVKVMRGASFVVLEGFTLAFSGYVEAAPDQVPALLDAAALGALTRAVPNALSGAGSPEAAVVGIIGDTYQALDGTTDTTLWVKEAGANTNTGWVANEAPA